MVEYCTAAQVFSFLQLGTTSGFGGTDFTENTTPTLADVEAEIVRSEDEINRATINSWKTITITKEYHSIKPPIHRYEGTQIFIGHRNVAVFSSGAGDKLEVWNGSTDEDYLLTRTEGRNNDYWVNEVDGILWLRTYPRILRRTFDVRLTYRFNEPTITKDIEKACIRLTAIALVSSDDKSLLFPEGSSNVPLLDKIQLWQSEADKIIQDNKELPIAIL